MSSTEVERFAQQITSRHVIAEVSGMVQALAELPGYRPIQVLARCMCKPPISHANFTVYEIYIVSQELHDVLTSKGERTSNDFTGHCLWSRRNAGTPACTDPVILDVAHQWLEARTRNARALLQASMDMNIPASA